MLVCGVYRNVVRFTNHFFVQLFYQLFCLSTTLKGQRVASGYVRARGRGILAELMGCCSVTGFAPHRVHALDPIIFSVHEYGPLTFHRSVRSSRRIAPTTGLHTSKSWRLVATECNKSKRCEQIGLFVVSCIQISTRHLAVLHRMGAGG